MLRCLLLFVVVLGATLGYSQEKSAPKNFTNTVGMEFVLIPAGSFIMGSTNQEKGRGDDEGHHKVAFAKPLYFGVHTVTQEQWLAVMGNNPSYFKGAKNLPVDSVTWHDCQDYCKKLQAKEKKPYRLLTEAEWEYVCRAGTATAFHMGETMAPDQANYNGNFTYRDGKTGVYRAKTTPVGSFPPNAWGLFDMHGNVSQWCHDWSGGYSRTETTDPQGPKSGKTRVLRGGSWSNHPIFCRSANRNSSEPDTRLEHYGFRVCFTAE